ncbi:lytic polysaccharide monooxygenase auxiliary activity family 9 protein, partial [Streptomyces galbus]|uniref:lytic polysaccharide monooxygenase auxiliary activity family 9 protein n=1 Tax=Streptomyces galbus TaxID=33898 RepID=UPI001FFBA92C
MDMKRRTAFVIGALAAPVLAVSLPASSAVAHGWVTLPTSRQEQCAEGLVDCGQIKYEPQSVEGPKGLQSCSGGHAEYAELDNDSKPWKVTPVGTTATFTWHNTARHSTANWQYFIGGQKIAEFDGRNQQPAADVSQQVNFGSFTGRQKVLAVWNIADTAARAADADVDAGVERVRGVGDVPDGGHLLTAREAAEGDLLADGRRRPLGAPV